VPDEFHPGGGSTFEWTNHAGTTTDPEESLVGGRMRAD
jgi:hypothetical protein